MSAQTPSRISRCLRATTFPERTRLRNPSPSFSILNQNAASLHIAYPLFSFIFLIFLSIFIHFYLFFHIFLFYTFHVASIFTSFFCFCERGSGGVWPAGGAWARQRGVWPANCVHSVGSERAEAVQGRCPCTAQLCCSHQPARKTAFCLFFLTAAGKLVCMVGCALF